VPPVIALLTDFGLRDHYVGAMKGAILSVCPEASLVDVVHDLPPHDITAGALALEATYRFFPPGTVFVAVVDPGVGSRRRGIGLAAGGWLFVGPDNGLFTLLLDAHPGAPVHLIANPALSRVPVSPVFHGRDVFGPAAGWLARGRSLAELGPQVTDPVRLELPRKRSHHDEWQGAVIHVDRFGNLTTNLDERDLDSLAGSGREGVEVVLGEAVLPLVRTYADVAVGQPCALVGSGGRVEIAINQGRAADSLSAGKGTPVLLRRR